jgi:C-terminal processing protease CtpA/Prc
MSGMNNVIAGATALMLLTATAPAIAQNDATVDDRAAQAEERRVEQEAMAAERELRRAEQSFERARLRDGQVNGAGVEEIDVQMREAEERLAEAAARIAELSTRRLPQITSSIVEGMRAHNRAMLGITIDAEGERGPVEGVTVAGVTPGSAAAEAGLRAGDVITAVNGESLGADTDEEANEKLVDFMAGVQDGDTLDVEYLRDGRSATVQVRPRRVSYSFAWRTDRSRPGMAPPAPPAPGFFFRAGIGSWGDMEMVSLTEDLGRYFGTDKGLLVVRAPTHESLKLRDGDVIQSIDGREPSSVAHAMRILASYQGGEELDLEIMREGKRQTIRIEMPDDRQSSLRGGGSAAPQFRFRTMAPATP